MPRTKLLIGTLLLLASLAGCKKTKMVATTTAPTAQPATAPASQPAAAPGGGAGGLSGTVAETLNSGGYTYIKLTTPAGDKWAAVQKAEIKVGQRVTVANAMEMKNFTSKTLKRQFPSIYFGALGKPGASASPHGKAAPKGVSKPHSKLGGKKAALSQPVAKAEGATGRTVAEVYAGKATLKDQPVAIRGKVVKLNRGILGRNWLHLQDGSGSEAGADFDLTVTSKDVAEVGQIVLVKGVVRLNKDFGSGYKYPVLVEDAKVVK